MPSPEVEAALKEQETDKRIKDLTPMHESICADVRQLAALQKDDSTALADSICVLVRRLAA